MRTNDEDQTPTRTADRFARVPAAAVSDPRLAPETLRVLNALCLFVDAEGHCYPSQGLLGKLLGRSRQCIQYHIRKLQQHGYVKVKQLKRPNGTNYANNYRVLYPDWSVSGGVQAHIQAEGQANALARAQVRPLPRAQAEAEHKQPMEQPTPTTNPTREESL